MTTSSHDDMVRLIGDSVRQVFGDLVTPQLIGAVEAGEWPAQLWDTVADSGFDRALVPEAAGGIAASWSAALPILVGMGQWQVPLPLAESMVARFLAAAGGVDLPDGPVTVADAGRRDTLTLSADGCVLDGTVRGVPWARASKAVVIGLPGTAPRIAVVRLDAAGVALVRGQNSAGEPRDRLTFQAVPCVVAPLPMFAGLDRPARSLGAYARSAAMAGALASILDQSVQYANDRVQFGRPIGKFQALQQNLALMAGEVTAARMAVDAAAVTLPGFDAQSGVNVIDDRCLFDLAVAKVRTGEAATQVAPMAHAVHGAIGFTHEHRLHYATRRVWSWRAEFGSDGEWADLLGQAMMAAGGDGFWDMIAARRLAV